jgi:hypothetical protein
MAKTTLTLDIEYDDEVTDPEALASAADRLLETVLSTPGIVEEYGDPRFSEFYVAASADHDLQDYTLHIDGPLLANQRQLLLKVFDTVFRGDPYVAESPKDEELLQGVIVLLDEIADQAHDCHGLASLLEAEDSEEPVNPGPHNQYRCECELPGFFCSGVPGILAHMENGRLVDDSDVERCDLCCRYPSDAAAREKLQELGLAPP